VALQCDSVKLELAYVSTVQYLKASKDATDVILGAYDGASAQDKRAVLAGLALVKTAEKELQDAHDSYEASVHDLAMLQKWRLGRKAKGEYETATAWKKWLESQWLTSQCEDCRTDRCHVWGRGLDLRSAGDGLGKMRELRQKRLLKFDEPDKFATPGMQGENDPAAASA
jgi:hypothetical protein